MPGGSDHTGSTLVGDHNQRITVPVPRSLNDLKGAATRHFKGAKGLYHNGRMEMTHPNHLSGLKHNDVIVVALDDMPKEAIPCSTHAAHYIRYEVQAPRASAKARGEPVPTLPFEGESRYASDFIRHPMEHVAAVRPKPSQWDSRDLPGFTGQSTYASHYPWHNPQRPPPVGARPGDLANSTAPFDGSTSYARDFVQHPLGPRTRGGPTQGQQVENGPFEGITTYSVDYHRHPFHDRIPRTEQRNQYESNTGPFQGTTEYAREYLQHQMEVPIMVHIEPELRSPHQSRPKSAPSSARNRQAPPRQAHRPPSRGSGRPGSRRR